MHPVCTDGMKDESILLALWTPSMMVVLAYFVMLTKSKVNSVEGRRSACECGGFIGGRLNERGQ